MDFKEAVKKAGFKSMAQFARHYGITPSSVSRWLKPTHKVPQWAAVVLNERKGAMDELAALVASREADIHKAIVDDRIWLSNQLQSDRIWDTKPVDKEDKQ